MCATKNKRSWKRSLVIPDSKALHHGIARSQPVTRASASLEEVWVTLAIDARSSFVGTSYKSRDYQVT